MKTSKFKFKIEYYSGYTRTVVVSAKDWDHAYDKAMKHINKNRIAMITLL